MQEIQSWNPDFSLKSVSDKEVTFSGGLKKINFKEVFSQLCSEWQNFLLRFADKVEIDFRVLFELPTERLKTEILKTAIFKVGNETCLIGFPPQVEEVLEELFTNNRSESSSDLVLEYFARRFVGSLAMFSKLQDLREVSFVEMSERQFLSVASVIEIQLIIGKSQSLLYLGLGTKTTTLLDRVARDQLSLLPTYSIEKADTKISIALVELAVPPAALIEYLRSGAIIDLQVSVSSRVLVFSQLGRLAEADLRKCDGMFAVEILSSSHRNQQTPLGKTAVIIEVASFSVDHKNIENLNSPETLFLTSTPISNIANVIVSGEKVATGVVGVMKDKFCLTIL